MITLSPINQSYTLQLHNYIQFICTTSPNSSSVTASVHNILVFRSHRQSFVSSIVHNALRQDHPCVDQSLSEIGHVSNWRLIQMSLNHA